MKDFKMGSFASLSEAVLEIFVFKVRKRGDFFRKICPLRNSIKWGQNL